MANEATVHFSCSLLVRELHVLNQMPQLLLVPLLLPFSVNEVCLLICVEDTRDQITACDWSPDGK